MVRIRDGWAPPSHRGLTLLETLPLSSFLLGVTLGSRMGQPVIFETYIQYNPCRTVCRLVSKVVTCLLEFDAEQNRLRRIRLFCIHR